MADATQKKKPKSGGFQSFGLAYPVYSGILKMGYNLPTPIQRRAIPAIIKGHDTVVMARTGSGKTAAFLIPMLHKLAEHHTTVGVRSVILSPTRELAMQTLSFANKIGRATGLRHCLLVGGDSMEDQYSALAKNPDSIIATPGRLCHHMEEVKLELRSVVYFCVDEADRLFEMGVQDQLHQIVQALPPSRQSVLCSATLPRALLDFARGGGDAGMAALKEPVEYIRLDAETKVSENLRMGFFQLRPEEKIGALLFILRTLVKADQQTIIFTATRHHVELLSELLPKCGFPVSPVFGQMDQAARVIHLAKFQKKQSMILLVTDVAARGIDIPLLANVINFDFPAKPKLFVHRVGRTARQGQSGTAYSLVQNDELAYMLDLMLFLGIKPVTAGPTLTETDKKKDLQLTGNPNTEVFYGLIPRHALDEESDTARSVISQEAQLGAQQKSANNATKLYNKTRESASKSSAARSRHLPAAQIHPWLAHLVNDEDAKKAVLMTAVKQFQPKSTVLEMKQDSLAYHTMKRKRVTDGYTVAVRRHANKHKDQQQDNENQELEDHEEGVATNEHKWKDKDFFIEYEPPDRDRAADFGFEIGGGSHMQMESEVLDLSGDTESGMRKSKQVRKWDAKKKRYVMMELDNEGRAKRQKVNEAGGIVDSKSLKNRGRSYKDWQKKMRMSIPKVGEQESFNAGKQWDEERSTQYKWINGRKIKMGPGQNATDKGGGPDSELRSAEQIAKLRKEAEKKKNKNSKGHSGGKSADFKKSNGIKKPGWKSGSKTHGGNLRDRQPGPGKKQPKPTKKKLAPTKFTKGKQSRKSSGAKKK